MSKQSRNRKKGITNKKTYVARHTTITGRTREMEVAEIEREKRIQESKLLVLPQVERDRPMEDSHTASVGGELDAEIDARATSDAPKVVEEVRVEEVPAVHTKERRNAGYILGLHYGHDATIVVMRHGKVLEAMSEERLSRAKKHTGFPYLALRYVRAKYGDGVDDNVFIVGDPQFMAGWAFGTKESNIEGRKNLVAPRYYERSLGVFMPAAGKLFAIRDQIFEKYVEFTRGRGNDYEARTRTLLREQLPHSHITFMRHHEAHAWASVPFMEDRSLPHVVLTCDGAGDGESATVSVFSSGDMKKIASTSVRSSLGMLYCAFVDILGMTRNEHEFKVMGLAPYAKASSGEKVYNKLAQLVTLNHETLTFESTIDLSKATPYLIAKSYYVHRFDSLAYGIQKLTEELLKKFVLASIQKTQIPRVALGGGVFMNVKANQHILALPEVSSLTITPSCGDESLALGAAIYGYALQHNHDLSGLEKISDLYLGSEYSDEQIKNIIDSYGEYTQGCTITYYDPLSSHTVEHEVAHILSRNSVVGRFKGRSEWGARALGNRSILANPTSRDNVKLINEMIKGRDFWMPFATSVLEDHVQSYMYTPHAEGKDYYAPFMAITFPTKPRAHSDLIAALHPYDLTSRPQMVRQSVNPEYHALISHFYQLTGSGGILNTSFNLHGEPNVESPCDALRTFSLSGLPHVAIGNYLISKPEVRVWEEDNNL